MKQKKKGFLDKQAEALEQSTLKDSDFVRMCFLIVYLILSLVSFFGFFFTLFWYVELFSFAVSWLNLGRLVVLVIIFKVSEHLHYLKILLFLFLDLLAFYTIGYLFVNSVKKYLETKKYWRKKYDETKRESSKESN